MGTLEFWQISAFWCIYFMMFMYSILDGFDLGVGTLIGFVSSDDADKKKLLASISPFWDGNEVWLVIAVSALFAAFPPVYSKLLPSFYLPFLSIIMLFICRAVSLESVYAGKSLSKISLAIFSITSFLASSIGILFLAVMVSGFSADASGAFKVGAADILRPFPIVFATAWFAMMLLHSTSYMARKCDGPLKERLLRCARILWPVFMVLFSAGILFLVLRMPEVRFRPIVWIGAVMAASGAVLHRLSLRPSREKLMFPFSAVSMGGVWVVAAGSLFPNIVNPAQGGAALMTVYNSSAPADTLRLVVLCSIAGMAAIIAYAVFVYGIFSSGDELKTH